MKEKDDSQGVLLYVLANKEYFDVKSTAQRNKIFELEFPFYCTSTSFSLIKTLILYLKF